MSQPHVSLRSKKRVPVFPGAVVDAMIVDLLRSSPIPLGAYDLLEQLRTREGFRSLMAIYRSLERLRSRAIVHRVESLSAYRLREFEEPFVLACRRCGVARSVAACAPYRQLASEAADVGFSLDKLVVEAVGTCHACQMTAKSDPSHVSF